MDEKIAQLDTEAILSEWHSDDISVNERQVRNRGYPLALSPLPWGADESLILLTRWLSAFQLEQTGHFVNHFCKFPFVNKKCRSLFKLKNLNFGWDIVIQHVLLSSNIDRMLFQKDKLINSNYLFYIFHNKYVFASKKLRSLKGVSMCELHSSADSFKGPINNANGNRNVTDSAINDINNHTHNLFQCDVQYFVKDTSSFIQNSDTKSCPSAANSTPVGLVVLGKMHDGVINWKHFPRYWPFLRGIHRWPVNTPQKGQWRGALMFPLICTPINDWAINREAGDLSRHRAHYEVTVM